MATRPGTLAFLLDQMADAGAVSAKKMFGEYGIFLDGKMIAIVGEDRLYLKATAPGRALLATVTEAPPYPGAKPCFLIPEEDWVRVGHELIQLGRRVCAARQPRCGECPLNDLCPLAFTF